MHLPPRVRSVTSAFSSSSASTAAVWLQCAASIRGVQSEPAARASMGAPAATSARIDADIAALGGQCSADQPFRSVVERKDSRRRSPADGKLAISLLVASSVQDIEKSVEKAVQRQPSFSGW